MRFKSDKAKVKNLFLKNKMVGKKIHGKAQQGIHSPARSIMIGLQGHKLPEQRIEKIQNRENG